MKLCRKCNIEKPLTEFYTPKRSYCKVCIRKANNKNNKKSSDTETEVEDFDIYFKAGYKQRIRHYIETEIMPDLLKIRKEYEKRRFFEG